MWLAVAHEFAEFIEPVYFVACLGNARMGVHLHHVMRSKEWPLDYLQEIAKAPELFKEIYGDLAKPGVQQVGKALGTVLGLGNTILWPIFYLNERTRIALNHNLEKYRIKMESIPQDEICQVSPEIGVPVAEKLSYVTNEEIGGMYIELLAKASQINKANQAHPSFVNVIGNLSPDEAILLKSIDKMTGIPFIEVRLQFNGKAEWITLDTMMPGVSCLGELSFPINIKAYLSNLEGLGIIRVRQDIFMVGENIYEPLENYARKIFNEQERKNPDKVLAFERGKMEITPFGRLFISACFSHTDA